MDSILKKQISQKQKPLWLASPSQNSSKLWSEIIANAKLLIENSRSLIGDGTETHFWTDNWLLDKPLIEYATADPLCFPKISELLDIAMGTGTYNLLLVSSHLKLLKASSAQISFFQKTRTELCGLRRTQVASLFGQLGSEFVIELRKRPGQKQFGARMSHQSLTSLL